MASSFLVSAVCVLSIRSRQGLGAVSAPASRRIVESDGRLESVSTDDRDRGPEQARDLTPATVPQEPRIDPTTVLGHPDIDPTLLAHPGGEEPAPGQLGWRAFAAEVAEGLRFVAAQSALRGLAVAGMLLAFGFRFGGTVWMLFVTKELGVTTGRQGLIYALGGLSSLAGAMLASRVTGRLGLGRSLAICWVSQPSARPSSPGPQRRRRASPTIAQQLITDPAVTIYEVAAVSLRQRLTPDALLGRMNASLRTLDFAASLAGAALAGLLGDVIGLRATLLGVRRRCCWRHCRSDCHRCTGCVKERR